MGECDRVVTRPHPCSPLGSRLPNSVPDVHRFLPANRGNPLRCPCTATDAVIGVERERE